MGACVCHMQTPARSGGKEWWGGEWGAVCRYVASDGLSEEWHWSRDLEEGRDCSPCDAGISAGFEPAPRFPRLGEALASRLVTISTESLNHFVSVRGSLSCKVQRAVPWVAADPRNDPGWDNPQCNQDGLCDEARGASLGSVRNGGVRSTRGGLGAGECPLSPVGLGRSTHRTLSRPGRSWTKSPPTGLSCSVAVARLRVYSSEALDLEPTRSRYWITWESFAGSSWSNTPCAEWDATQEN